MTVSLKHAFTSPVADNGDANEVGPDEWNAEHTFTISGDRIVGRLSSDGAVQELTATQVRTLLNVENGATADQSAAEILTALLTVDGAGTGLDADLLDGNEASAFLQDITGEAIDDLSDVTVTSLGDGELLASSSGTWINQTLAEAGIQPLDSDLTSIAALTTTSFGRGLLELADEDALEALLDTLPNLASIQGVSFTFGAYAPTLLNTANEAGFKAAVNLEIGTDVLAQQTIGISDDNLLEVDGDPNSGEVAVFTANGLAGQTEGEFKSAFNLEAGTDFYSISAADAAFHPLTTVGISNDNLLEVDGSPNDDEYARFTANGLEGRTVNEVLSDLGFPQRGHIVGLTISNNSTDAEHDLDFAGGQASADASPYPIMAGSALTKQIDASWAVGDDAGMLDGSETSAGTPDADTWYHIFIIMRSDTGVVDYLASESPTAPTLPTNYDYQRRIGSVYIDSSNNVTAFSQFGDEFLLDTMIIETEGAAIPDSPTNVTITTPSGIQVLAKIGIWLFDSIESLARVYTPDTADTTLDFGASGGTYNMYAFADAELDFKEMLIRTNTSSQIRWVESANGGVGTIVVMGWIDYRGRFGDP